MDINWQWFRCVCVRKQPISFRPYTRQKPIIIMPKKLLVVSLTWCWNLINSYNFVFRVNYRSSSTSPGFTCNMNMLFSSTRKPSVNDLSFAIGQPLSRYINSLIRPAEWIQSSKYPLLDVDTAIFSRCKTLLAACPHTGPIRDIPSGEVRGVFPQLHVRQRVPRART